MKKFLKILLLIIIWPLTLTYLLLKSNTSGKLKVSGLIGIWFIALALGAASEQATNGNKKIEDKTISVTNVTTAAETTVSETTTTKSTTKVTTVTTASSNPLMNYKLNKETSPQNMKYAYIQADKSNMTNITARQLQEFVNNSGAGLEWLSIKYSDGTGIYFPTFSSPVTYGKYGKLDDQGAITNGFGIIDFENDIIKFCDNDYNELSESQAFPSDGFDNMIVTEAAPEAVTDPSTPDPEPVQQQANEPSVTDRSQWKVYIADSGNGKKYHNDPKCGTMDGVIELTIEEALAQGYTACKKCA
ncbi:MAG: hypothetical protein Q4F95_03460 [Oscillospiraceae bacterium]|nr:hypothetical protein [Oscillospiraceae bacterium]